MMTRPYYEAYDLRYKTIHEMGLQWSSSIPTPIVLETIHSYGIEPNQPILEIGCGEGRDAVPILKEGYHLWATDISAQAISYCQRLFPDFAEHFGVLDCIHGSDSNQYSFIYAVAVLHMLVRDEDRAGFYYFVRSHLKDDGLALICTMGDGVMEAQTDPDSAFELQERNHGSGKVVVAGTSCRMVSFPVFMHELHENGFQIVSSGTTAALPDFNSLMYAVIQKA